MTNSTSYIPLVDATVPMNQQLSSEQFEERFNTVYDGLRCGLQACWSEIEREGRLDLSSIVIVWDLLFRTSHLEIRFYYAYDHPSIISVSANLTARLETWVQETFRPFERWPFARAHWTIDRPSQHEVVAARSELRRGKMQPAIDLGG